MRGLGLAHLGKGTRAIADHVAARCQVATAQCRMCSLVKSCTGVRRIYRGRPSAPNVSVLKLTPQLQFTENELKAANAKVFFGYKTSSGVFINKGQIWPK